MDVGKRLFVSGAVGLSKPEFRAMIGILGPKGDTGEMEVIFLAVPDGGEERPDLMLNRKNRRLGRRRKIDEHQVPS